jgi:multiple sugar transport system permease protein
MLTALRGAGDITMGNLWGLPSEWLFFGNLTAVFTNTPMALFLLNSLKITVPTMLGAVALSCMTGFALAAYKFKGNLLLFFLFVAGNFVPFQILMIPVRDLTFQLGLYDTVTGLVMFHVAFQTGFCTLFMRNFIKALPHELLEAARIDGASEFKIFWKIVMPLTRPAIAALCVLIFTFIWNDYFWATVLIQGNHAMPVTAGLKSLNGQWISAYHLIATGSLVAALPPVLIFFAMQKHFIAGLTLGASKG